MERSGGGFVHCWERSDFVSSEEMRPRHYILKENGVPAVENDLMKWCAWLQEAKAKGIKRVGSDMIGEVHVSTVFLGLDHAFMHGPPILWETMVFGGPLHEECERCAGNREQAEAMHARWCERVRELQAGPKP